MTAAPRWWLGIVITVASNVLISLSLNCQKLAHMRLQRADETAPLLARPVSYVRSRLWWMGVLLMMLGESGNFVSYGLAPASLISPLGAVSLLSNVIIAPTLLGERLDVWDMAGMALSIIGAVSVVCSVGPSGSTPFDPPALWDALAAPTFVVYAACMLTLGAVLIFVVDRTRLGARSIFAHVGICAVFGGFTVLATKAVSSFVVHARSALVREPLVYLLLAVLLSTAILQLVYLNQALQRFESRHVIPSQFVLFTISTIVGSSILYHDLARLGVARTLAFLAGCVCTCLGVYVLTLDVSSSSSPAAPHAGPTVVVSSEEYAPRASPLDVPHPPRPSTRVLCHARTQSDSHPIAMPTAMLGISPGRHLLSVSAPKRACT